MCVNVVGGFDCNYWEVLPGVAAEKSNSRDFLSMITYVLTSF